MPSMPSMPDSGFPTLALLTFGDGSFFAVGAVLYIVGCPAVPLASTCWMLGHRHSSRDNHKCLQTLVMCPVGPKSSSPRTISVAHGGAESLWQPGYLSKWYLRTRLLGKAVREMRLYPVAFSSPSVPSHLSCRPSGHIPGKDGGRRDRLPADEASTNKSSCLLPQGSLREPLLASSCFSSWWVC